LLGLEREGQALPARQRAVARTDVRKRRAARGQNSPSTVSASSDDPRAGSLPRAGGSPLPRRRRLRGLATLYGQGIDAIRNLNPITLAGFRDALGISRRVAQLLLERYDADGLTRRVGDERVLRKAARQ
jgi:hypothetical protein